MIKNFKLKLNELHQKYKAKKDDYFYIVTFSTLSFSYIYNILKQYHIYHLENYFKLLTIFLKQLPLIS